MGIENDTQHNEAYHTNNKYAIPALTGTKNRTQHTGGVTHTTRASLSLTGIENDTQQTRGSFPAHNKAPRPSWVSKTIPST